MRERWMSVVLHRHKLKLTMRSSKGFFIRSCRALPFSRAKVGFFRPTFAPGDGLEALWMVGLLAAFVLSSFMIAIELEWSSDRRSK